ncbi:uncharacterized protein J3D65DRAFT_670602 [Phyllosticta citribraziliensis]|uniref:F-box domain-containing protein n=1 Tax=Phyllosticta citribraziliensis TaxID=989973 RepID=A0ABR1L9P0_9PEZI
MATDNPFLIAVLGLWLSSQNNSPLARLPTELVGKIAAYLPDNDLTRFALTSRKIHEDVMTILFRKVTVDMHSMDPKLALVARSLRENDHLLPYLHSLDLRYMVFHPHLYRPEVVTSIRGVERSGAAYPAAKAVPEDKLYGREDVHLRAILESSSCLQHLKLEILGDKLPRMRVIDSLRNLKTLHLGRWPHTYGKGVQNHHLTRLYNKNRSLREMVWIFQLPRLVHLSLHQFGAIRDVGLITSSRQRRFKIRTLDFKETSFAGEPGLSLRDAYGHFFAAFESLEAVDWFLQPHQLQKVNIAEWIVGGLEAHKSTLRHLLLRENHIMTHPWGFHQLPLHDDAFSSRQRGMTFAHFAALKSLTIIGEAFADSDWDSANHKFFDDNEAKNLLLKLPKSLKTLNIAQYALRIGPALHLTATIELQTPLRQSLLYQSNHQTSHRDMGINLALLPARGIDGPPFHETSSHVPDFVDRAFIEERWARVPTLRDNEDSYPGICRNLVDHYVFTLLLVHQFKQLLGQE